MHMGLSSTSLIHVTPTSLSSYSQLKLQIYDLSVYHHFQTQPYPFFWLVEHVCWWLNPDIAACLMIKSSILDGYLSSITQYMQTYIPLYIPIRPIVHINT